MSKPDLITFTRTDTLPSHIENIAKEIADHFKRRRLYLPQFCGLIKTSKRWSVNNMNYKLENWEARFSRIQGTSKIIEIVKRGFNSCQTDDEINILRGAMVEALVIGVNGGTQTLNNKSYGWGASVDIQLDNGVTSVKYICNEHKESGCKNRSTVDFGSWNGYHGKFYECKAQPAGIGCKEVNYMKKLKSELTSRSISHEIFFVCADHREEVEMKLQSFGLSLLYKPLGIEDLRTMSA